VKVIYIGPSTTGVIIAATGQLVEQGASVDVPDDIAAGLLVQVDDWQPAKGEPSKRSTAAVSGQSEEV
jgi:hypothetical protein